MNPVTLTFDFTVEDWAAFLDRHSRQSAYMKKMRRFAMFLIPLIFGLVLLIGFIRHNLTYTEICICVTVSLFWIYASIRTQSPQRRKKRFQKMLAGDNSTVLGLQTVTAAEEGLTIVYPMGESRFQWQAFKKRVETGDHLFLYDTTLSAVIIPKTKASGDMAAFMAVVKEWMKI